MKAVIVRELALQGLEEAAAWYEGQQIGLGYAFVREWESAIDFISRHPDSIRKRFKEFRVVGIRRFPYVIVFESEKDVIVVYNVIYSGRKMSTRYKTR
jgi:plasmid stabilization system protein ParE